MSMLIQMVMLLTAMLMIAAPWACLRREDREDGAARQKVRSMGAWLAAAAVIWIVVEELI